MLNVAYFLRRTFDFENTRTHTFLYGLVTRWNEKIQIACLDEDGEPMLGCAWRVSRHRLTEAALQNMCLTCPAQIKVRFCKRMGFFGLSSRPLQGCRIRYCPFLI